MRHPRYFRLGIPALVALIGVAGFVLTTSLLAADREAEVKRRAQLQSVRAQGVLASARAYVAGLGNVLESETTRTQRRFVELAGSATSGVGLIDVFWVQRVPASARARGRATSSAPARRSRAWPAGASCGHRTPRPTCPRRSRARRATS